MLPLAALLPIATTARNEAQVFRAVGAKTALEILLRSQPRLA
jgi:hypothetical protein